MKLGFQTKFYKQKMFCLFSVHLFTTEEGIQITVKLSKYKYLKCVYILTAWTLNSKVDAGKNIFRQ